jgi:hypothetical protein
MSSPPWNSPVYWRSMSDEMRKLADDAKDVSTRAMMLRIVDEYNERAKKAERREKAVRN